MVAKALNTVSIVGESRKGKPNKFIIAAFNEKMILYIPYNVKAPYNNIVIQVDNRYFVATANEADVMAIVSYMKKQGVLK